MQTLQRYVTLSMNRILVNSSLGAAFVPNILRLCIRYHSTKMSTVFVRNFDTDDRLQISLDLKIPAANENSTTGNSSSNPGANSHNCNVKFKTFNLNRLKSEELKLAVDRLRLSLSKKIVSKKNKKSQKKTKGSSETKEENKTSAASAVSIAEAADSEVPIEIILNGNILDQSVSNEHAWVEGAVLKVWEEEIPIVYNPPTVKLESLPNYIMAGFPLFPEVKCDFTHINNCDFYWKLFNENTLNKLKAQAERGQLDLTDAVNTFSFTPGEEHIGQHVLLVCIPRAGDKVGKMEVTFSAKAITAGPGLCPFDKRHEFTKELSADGEFRVLSYNLLAQMYADTDVAKEELFRHCPAPALDMDYRKHLLLKEIIGYQSDLLCLQEVDKSIFTSHLSPALETLGFTGLFRVKDGQTHEGCASFIQNSKFRVVQELDIVLTPFLASDPICADMWMEVCKIPPLKEKLEQRPTILQVTVVESKQKPGHYVCLANTHLYFHPTADNIRLLQTAVAIRYLQQVCATYIQEGKNISLVFCGDFNSSPPFGVYQLLTAQFIPTDYADWRSAGDDETLTSLELHQPLNMESACGTPAYTNFTVGFQDTLDYIFIESDKLAVTKVVPLPSHEDVVANVALPNVVFPSDHLALICDLKFR